MTIDDLYSKIYPIKDPDLKRELMTCTEIRRLVKNEFLTYQEETDEFLCFLKSGVIGTFELFPDGRTVCLSVTDCPGGIVVGGLGPNDIYSPVNIMALTRVELFAVRMTEMQHLLAVYPEIQSFYNHILMKAYEEQWQVKNMLYMEDARERYEWFIDHHPGTVEKINHKTIASYLRMSPVTFSRIRHDWKGKRR